MSAKFSIFEEAAQNLARVQVNSATFKKYVQASGLVPTIKDGADSSTRAGNIMEEVSALFEGRQKGGLMPGVKGTAWGAFNAIGEYVDFHRATRAAGVSGDMNRATSLLFGSGAAIKQKAWDSALSLV